MKLIVPVCSSYCACLNLNLIHCVGAEVCYKVPGSVSTTLQSHSQSAGKPKPTSFPSDLGYWHITSIAFLSHLRGELLFVLANINQHICTISF